MVEKPKSVSKDLKDGVCLLNYLKLFVISTEHINGDPGLINEFTCILCLNVVTKPLLINCCDRLFCFTCSFKMLESTEKCPFCKSKDSNFSNPSKILIRIMNNFIITCPLSALFKDDKGKVLECSEYVCHQSYLEHILNKCNIKKYLVTNIKKDDLPLLNEKKIKNSNVICNTDNKIYISETKLTEKIISSKKINSNYHDFLTLSYIVKNYSFCGLCDVPDSTDSHICNTIKFTTICNTNQKAILKYLNKKNEERQPSNTPIQTDLHEHPVYYMNFRNAISIDGTVTTVHSWSCDFCLKSQYVPITTLSYNCTECDLDICSDCFSMTKLRQANKNIHEHQLKVRNDGKHWSCDECEYNFGARISFFCESCNFDICLNCYYK